MHVFLFSQNMLKHLPKNLQVSKPGGRKEHGWQEQRCAPERAKVSKPRKMMSVCLVAGREG